MTYIVRDAKENDIEEICQLCIESANVYLDLKVLSKEQFKTFFNKAATRERMFKDNLQSDDAYCSVAIGEDNNVIGFCKGGQLSKENIAMVKQYNNKFFADLSKVFSFQSTYVKPNQKYSGIGSALRLDVTNKAMNKGFKHGMSIALVGNSSPEFYKKISGEHIFNFVQNPFTGELVDTNCYKHDGQFLAQTVYGFASLEEKRSRCESFANKANLGAIKKCG